MCQSRMDRIIGEIVVSVANNKKTIRTLTWENLQTRLTLAAVVILMLTFLPTSPLTALAQRIHMRPSYTMVVTFDYAQHTASVQQHIGYTNLTGDNLSEIALVVDPNKYPRAFTLRSMHLAKGAPVNGYSLVDILLSVSLDKPLAPGETIDLYLDYDLTLPYLPAITVEDGAWPDPFGYTPRQINLADWYPFIPPYDSESGWVVHPPKAYGEHQVYPAADFDIYLTVLSAPEDLRIAASAMPENDGQPYRYKLKGARNFVLSFSDAYILQQTEVNGVTLQAYHLPGSGVAGETAFQTFVEAFRLYESLFTDYPHDSLTLVQADFSLSMEYDGLIFITREAYHPFAGDAESAIARLTAHEVSHQWWYGLVGSDQALEPWLDEALASYSERLFYEYLHPEALEWWDFRLEFARPHGTLDDSIYDSGHSQAYFDRIYLTGARFLHELRQEIGDTGFFRFLSRYAASHSQQIASSEDFFGTLAQVSDHVEPDLADISVLVESYFKNSSNVTFTPSLTLTHSLTFTQNTTLCGGWLRFNHPCGSYHYRRPFTP